MGMIDRMQGVIDSLWSAPHTNVSGRPDVASQYMRGGRNMTFANWPTSLMSARSDVGEAWDQATGRAIESIQNSGWISGMIDQAVANTVGTGLRLRSLPDHEALGITPKEAGDLGRLFQRRFKVWAENKHECDIEGRRNFAQMQAASFKSWFPTGETWAELPWRERQGLEFGTKVRLLPPTRITRTSAPWEQLVQGVYMDADDRAIGYHTYKMTSGGYKKEYKVPAYKRGGGPNVLHVFDGDLGTVRGITPMAGSLQITRMFDQLTDATLTSWLIQTIYTASVTSEAPTEETMAGLLSTTEQARATIAGMSNFDVWSAAQEGWYDGAPLDVGINGRIAHMFPGQEFKFMSPDNNAVDYKELATILLREIARCLGLTYESATGDYSGATYSSARMAVNEIFKVTLYRRSNIVQPFCQPVFAAVIEEDILRGRITVPGGYENFKRLRSAFLRSEWHGSPQPTADEYKAARTHETYRGMGVMTDETIAQALGTDIETVYDGLERERQMREDRGLDHIITKQTQILIEDDEEKDKDKKPEGGK